MKNLFLTATLLVFSLCIAQQGSASKSASTSVKFGLKLGINFATLSNLDDPSTSVSSRTGINIGGYLNYKFAKKFAFQQELLYTSQGAIANQDSNGTPVKLTFMFDYFAVPLMLKYYPTKAFNVEFGPQLGFIVSKKLKGEANGQSFTYDIDDFFAENNIDAKASKFDLGLNFGLGYEFENGINFSGRYTAGMIKVLKGPAMVYSNGSEQIIKNSVFSFGMGYTFR
ncbi:MAG TPA: porin family protein [Flavobacterium sp.]|uniref:porin family protein n=1 Tax=Flavobacterium sp. TaxID=239 RepID=UPI002B99D084|nr:porin family protein [Flavobacterium sp.]HNP33214.1 porin family protein [Flavobacterium sp.]